MAAISSASLYLRASSTGAEPSTGVTSGRAARRAMRNLLGQALSTPSVPGRSHIFFADISASLYRYYSFLKTVFLFYILIHGSLGYKGQAGFVLSFSMSCKHWLIENRLCSRNGCICIAHLRCNDHTAFDDNIRFCTKEYRIPENEVCEFTFFHRTHILGNTVCDCRINGIFGDITFYTEAVLLRLLH